MSLQVLVDALTADQAKPRGRRVLEHDHLSDAINLYLVLEGARPAARLDQTSYDRKRGALKSWRDSTLLSAFWQEAERRGRRADFSIAMDNYEPIVMNTTRVAERDAATIHKLYAHGNDIDQPLVGAIGRVLGYGCRWSDAPSAVIRVSTVIVPTTPASTGGNDGAPHQLHLAAFVCSEDDFAAMRAVSEALDGQEISWHGHGRMRKHVLRSTRVTVVRVS